ncbi:olfactory receptor 10Q1-like [Sarcophilus harrisii]
MSSSSTLHLNQSGTTEFVFRVFTTSPKIQALLFCFFLLLYIMTLCGNTTILWAVYAHTSLHIPMYFFLSNLSLVEICYTTIVVPLMLSNILGAQRPIPLAGCATQMLLFYTCAGAECFLLAVMAYDRYVAICQPLHYTLIMTQKRCIQLMVASLALPFYLELHLTILLFTLPFCGHRLEINHFFCDAPPVLRLACGDIRVQQAVIFVMGFFILTVPLVLISISYIFIANTILRIHSAEGRQRAFSTCSSHLSVVLLQYGCGILVYMHSKSSTSEDEDWQLALVYTFVIPLLNPLIYTLRNKDVKDALKNSMSCTAASELP